MGIFQLELNLPKEHVLTTHSYKYPTSIRAISNSELTLITIPIKNRLKCLKGKVNGWDEV